MVEVRSIIVLAYGFALRMKIADHLQGFHCQAELGYFYYLLRVISGSPRLWLVA